MKFGDMRSVGVIGLVEYGFKILRVHLVALLASRFDLHG